MNEELIPINVVLGDRTYRIRIAAGDEAHVRETLRIINQKVVDFKTQFAGQDMQDYVAMVLVWYATQITAPAAASIEQARLERALGTLEDQLDKALG